MNAACAYWCYIVTKEHEEEMVFAFCESQARDSLAKSELGSTVPRKMGLNWFMPAFANRSVGSLWGTTLEDGTAVWPLVSKNSTKVERTRLPACPSRGPSA